MNVGEQVRARRIHLGLTIAQLAERSGVSAGMLSGVERNAKSPTIRVLAAIAHGLDTNLSDLLADDTKSGIAATRASKIRPWTDESTGLERRQLSPRLAKSGVEFAHYRIPPNTDCGGYPGHAPGTIESLYVLAGKIRYYAGDEEVILDVGDAATCSADVIHGVENLSDVVAEYVVAVRNG